MKTFSITVSEEIANKLQLAAKKSGLTMEDFMIASLEKQLLKPDSAFENAADYVLEKNRELYKRLAK